jgi:hypothetical protein
MASYSVAKVGAFRRRRTRFNCAAAKRLPMPPPDRDAPLAEALAVS